MDAPSNAAPLTGDTGGIHPSVWTIVNAIERDDDGDGVIPIVGQGLLQIKAGDLTSSKEKRAELPATLIKALDDTLGETVQPVNLHTLIAQVLSRYLHLQNGASNGILSQIVAQHPQFDSNRYEVDTDLHNIYSAVSPEIPDVLRHLASIRSFEMFISTTPDDLLERALNEERFNGEPLTRAVSFSPTRRPTDETMAKAFNSGYPVVFYLFGRYRSPGCVALTESDFVDYIAALLDHESRPRRLFSELKGKHLLMIGNSFQNWLARFFLRLIKDTPFGDPSGGVQYVADQELLRDESFALFCRRCAKKAAPIENIDPTLFVRQLSHAWSTRVASRQVSGRSKIDVGLDSVSSDSIFISYARSDLGRRPSKDVERANRLADDLRKEGRKVWLDNKGGLQPGDDYARTIELAISRCGIFIPVCSEVTQMRPDSEVEKERPFYRREWTWAITRAETLQQEDAERKFILPVVVDDLPFGASNVPRAFKALHANRLKDGAASPEFLKEVETLIRRIRQREHAGT